MVKSCTKFTTDIHCLMVIILLLINKSTSDKTNTLQIYKLIINTSTNRNNYSVMCTWMKWNKTSKYVRSLNMCRLLQNIYYQKLLRSSLELRVECVYASAQRISFNEHQTNWFAIIGIKHIQLVKGNFFLSKLHCQKKSCN